MREIIIIAVFVFFCSASLAQSVNGQAKIDRAFQVLIALHKSKNNAAPANCSPGTKANPVQKNQSKDAIANKKYECIVYTKNAKALRSKGIIINSELPTFVTAWVTLEQIQQMAAMPEVTFIEAPQTDRNHVQQ